MPRLVRQVIDGYPQWLHRDEAQHDGVAAKDGAEHLVAVDAEAGGHGHEHGYNLRKASYVRRERAWSRGPAGRFVPLGHPFDSRAAAPRTDQQYTEDSPNPQRLTGAARGPPDVRTPQKRQSSAEATSGNQNVWTPCNGIRPAT